MDAKSVSQVITYGTMGAKTALRDVGRTLGIPLRGKPHRQSSFLTSRASHLKKPWILIKTRIQHEELKQAFR